MPKPPPDTSQSHAHLTAFFTPLSRLEPFPIQWLWPGRLPRAKLTLLSGPPEIGKSFLAADIAARITAALPWPDAPTSHSAPSTQHSALPPSDVLLCCAEDDYADTVLPRLTAAGGDPSRAFALSPAAYISFRPLPFSLPLHLPGLEEALDRCPHPSLIILDPLAAYLGPAADFGSEIQARLHPLIDLASRRNVAILAITHRDLRPTASFSLPARSMLAAARIAHHLSLDDTDPSGRRRRFTPIKNNLGPPPPPLAFSLTDNKITWHPDPLPPPKQEPTARQLAAAWLTDLLKSGPLPHRQVLDQSRAALFSYATLRRAALDLRILASSTGFHKTWTWELPNTPCATLAPLSNIGEFAEKPTSAPQCCSTPG